MTTQLNDGRNWKRMLKSNIHPTAGGGIQIDQDATPEQITAALADLESRVTLLPFDERRRQAALLLRIASDLLRAEPHVHVRTEHVGGPQPITLLTVTRQLYDDGNLANDAPLKSDLLL